MKKNEKQYEKEAVSRWGEDRVKKSNQLWNGYDSEKKEQIKAECYSIFKKLSDQKHHGIESRVVHDILIEWHQFFGYFYEPSLEVLRGLGDIYKYDLEFRAYFEEIDPELPDFAHAAINVYVDALEMRWLESQYEVLQE